jgi:hypothetical protein
VEDGRVRAAADDGAVGRGRRAALAEVVLDEGFDLVLHHAGPDGLHRLDVRLGRDVGGALHEPDLFVGLDEPHLPKDRARIGDRVGRDVEAAARAHLAELFDEYFVQIGAHAEAVVDVARAA